MIRKLSYFVLGIVALFLLVAALLPSSYTVERSIEIDKPPEAVFAQVSDYNQWLQWSAWPKLDPSAKQTVTGDPGKVGMSWSWEGEELGTGTMTLAHAEENRSIHSTLVFEAPMGSKADDYMTLEPTETGTRVTWRNTGGLPYPIGRYFGLTLDGMLGPQYEEGLRNLKARCESMEESSPPVEETSADEPVEEEPSA